MVVDISGCARAERYALAVCEVEVDRVPTCSDVDIMFCRIAPKDIDQHHGNWGNQVAHPFGVVIKQVKQMSRVSLAS